jgi:hypothetical protein
MMTAFASLWLLFSCATHAGMAYELDCDDLRCSDDIELSGSFELNDSFTFSPYTDYSKNILKGFEFKFLDKSTGQSEQFDMSNSQVSQFYFLPLENMSNVYFYFDFYNTNYGLDGLETSYDYLLFYGGDQGMERVTYFNGVDGRERNGRFDVTFAARGDNLGSADVSAPHAATILALGIMGFATRRFKKQS